MSVQARWHFPEQQAQAIQHHFERAARLLRQRTGIVLGAHKHEGMARVLQAACQRTGLVSFADYLNLLDNNSQSPEWQLFINAFTVNHTAFFREAHHFSVLARFLTERSTPVSVWSCAASTGEEASSIAITLLETLGSGASGSTVLATDIDTEAIARAREGVYTLDRVAGVSERRLENYFLRGKGVNQGLARLKPEVRQLIQFDVLNLIDQHWPVNRLFDAIFCRNTLIYFDKDTQLRLVNRLAGMLKPEGLLFVGHSENFTGLAGPLRLLGQTVYQLRN